MRVGSSVVVDAPIEPVWSIVSDPERVLSFMSGVTRWEPVGPARDGLGARYRMLLRVGAAEVGGLIEVVEWSAPTDFAWTSVTGVDQRGPLAAARAARRPHPGRAAVRLRRGRLGVQRMGGRARRCADRLGPRATHAQPAQAPGRARAAARARRRPPRGALTADCGPPGPEGTLEAVGQPRAQRPQPSRRPPPGRRRARRPAHPGSHGDRDRARHPPARRLARARRSGGRRRVDRRRDRPPAPGAADGYARRGRRDDRLRAGASRCAMRDRRAVAGRRTGRAAAGARRDRRPGAAAGVDRDAGGLGGDGPGRGPHRGLQHGLPHPGAVAARAAHCCSRR